MAKNIVICLDGTNNKLRAAANTNVVRMFDLLDLRDPAKQVGYYDPGVGTFSSPSAWTPVARTVSRYAGLMFGAGLKQNLGEAYTYLMSVYEPGDRIYVFGFSRGAYNARALTGLIELCGILRPGAENLVPYIVGEYCKQDDGERFNVLREYARIYARDLGLPHKDHAPVHFVGVWDTVKAAGHVWRQLKWPYTKQLPHAATVRHAMSIDEKRRPYVVEPVVPTNPKHLVKTPQDCLQVWFAGVHSDVGGRFEKGAPLSDIPFKWMAEHAVKAGLLVRSRAYDEASHVTDESATGAIHVMGKAWALLGTRRRKVPDGAVVHASVRRRIETDPGYAKKLPASFTYDDDDWATPKPLPPKEVVLDKPGVRAGLTE